VSIEFRVAHNMPEDVTLLAVPVWSDRDPDEPVALDWTYLEQRGFEGNAGQAQTMPGDLGIQILAVGMGSSENVTLDTFRRAGATIARFSRRQKVIATTLLDAAPDTLKRPVVARVIAEGLGLAAYRFDEYKSDPGPRELEHVTVVGAGGKRVQAGLDLGSEVAEAVCFTRDLVNEPGGALTPRKLADAARKMARRSGVGIQVLDEAGIRKAKLGGLLGVNRGSEHPPRFIELTYEPTKRSRGTVALVGKGITFDSGGYSIKTVDGMSTMKDDMGGAAAVLGAFSVLGSVDVPVTVKGYLPVTDNMISGDATRPGDVLHIRNGKTVEVLNTDAEGRLVLADALSMASEAKPDAIVDLATLTGSCQIALGNKIAGLMGNNRDLVAQVRDAARRAGERVWELPLPTDYRRQLNSDVADLKNVGSRYGGALIAGLFLQEFVGDDLPWAHLDIAGPAWSTEAEGITPKGATGYGVRLLLEFLGTFRRPKS
jgi:leucyl aminopeptidase